MVWEVIDSENCEVQQQAVEMARVVSRCYAVVVNGRFAHAEQAAAVVVVAATVAPDPVKVGLVGAVVQRVAAR